MTEFQIVGGLAVVILFVGLFGIGAEIYLVNRNLSNIADRLLDIDDHLRSKRP